MSLNLQVFNSSVTRLGVVDVITGLTWEEKFADAGSFELWCPVNDQNIDLLQEDNLLWIGGDSAGLIEFKELTSDDEGTQTIHVQGRTCECYLDFRTIYPRIVTSGKVSAVMRKLLTDHVISPSDTNRVISGIELDSSQTVLGSSISFQRTGDTVLLACSDLGQSHALGFKLKFVPQSKKFIFQIYQGTNRTVDQTATTPVLFSSELDDILESTYSHNKSNYRNVAYTAGEGEGSDRQVVSTGTATGLNRRELFVDARDLQSTKDDGSTISSSEYTAMLVERGKSKLEDYKDIKTFSATVRTFGVTSYIYGKDFQLGDTVTVYDARLKVQVNAMVTAVMKTFDEDGERLDITFGYSQPTLANKLRRMV